MSRSRSPNSGSPNPWAVRQLGIARPAAARAAQASLMSSSSSGSSGVIRW
ncbi:MAG: hypothetical protein V9F00_05585 [Nocardioides sp.]